MKKILLIEENANVRANMATILDLAGYSVATAENGKAGMFAALSDKPDLILCDIMMPILDGYGVLHMLQKNEGLQTVPFIFLVAKSERNEIRKGMEVGADDCITKPFNSTELLNSIEARLKKAELLKRPFATAIQGSDELIKISAGVDYLEGLRNGRNINCYKKKEIIYTEGNHPFRLFYLMKGKVKTYRRNDDGKELITGLFNEGEFMGYLPLMETITYKETAEAIEYTELAIIPRLEFDELLSSNQTVMMRFIEILAHKINEKEEQLLAIAYNSLRKKVSDVLITLYMKYNQEKNGAFLIDLSRDNMAAIAGVAKESLVRMLGELRDERVIEMEGSCIRIVDYSRLEKMHN
jgi:CRP-like cAMP-binding protein/CheY-like chemotaxis protein